MNSIPKVNQCESNSFLVSSKNTLRDNKGCIYLVIKLLICVICWLVFIGIPKKVDLHYVGTSTLAEYDVHTGKYSNVVHNGVIIDQSEHNDLEKAAVIFEGTVYRRIFRNDYFSGKVTIIEEDGTPNRVIGNVILKMYIDYHGAFSNSITILHNDSGRNVSNILNHVVLSKSLNEIYIYFKDDSMLVAPASNKEDAYEIMNKIFNRVK